MSVLIHIGDTYVIHNSRNKKIYRTSNSQEKQKKKKEKKLEKPKACRNYSNFHKISVYTLFKTMYCYVY